MKASIQDLQNSLTVAEPLGPIQHERMVPDVVNDLIYSRVPLFSEIGTKPHMVLLGRKGAGKSALLSQICKGQTRVNSPDDFLIENESCTGKDYLIHISAWQDFHSIVLSVKDSIGTSSEIDEIIPVEYFSDLWYHIFWDRIIKYFYAYASLDCFRIDLAAVHKHVNLDSDFGSQRQKNASKSFSDAKSSILTFLDKNKSRLFFLFDSLENFPVRNSTFLRIISGLFQGLTRLTDDSRNFIVSFCVPEEVESFVTSGSANLLKDFSSSFRIRWRPVDLLRIVAHRLIVSSQLFDKELYSRIKELDLSKRDELREIFNIFLPKKITNSRGIDERADAYVIRHTQLLPRHILAIFNSSLSIHYKNTGKLSSITEEAVRDGITNVEKTIAKQILFPYESIYPKLLSQCKSLLPELDPIFNYKSLSKIGKRFNRLIEEEISSPWDTLFDMGIIGRSVGKTGSDYHNFLSDERYCYGQFHFNIHGSFSTPSDGEFCFHPVFSRSFGIMRRNGDKRVVYPAHIDMDNIYDDA